MLQSIFRPRSGRSTRTTPARSRFRRRSRGATAMAEIELRHIDKHFGAVHVIRDVNLTVKDREFVVFLGPSGCGKTTTLRAIAGLEEIDSGDILLDGKPIQD